MPIDPKAIVAELDSVLAEYKSPSQINDIELAALTTKARSAIARLAPPNSAHHAAADRWQRIGLPPLQLQSLFGVVKALRDDWAAGRMTSAVELIHADAFSDFIAQSDYLLGTGFKLAAAVISGATLESHLRALCVKGGIPTTVPTRAGGTEPKKASSMNDDLYKASVYTKAEFQQVTAWLAIRNEAAHGNDKFSDTEVKVMSMGLRDFILRNPA